MVTAFCLAVIILNALHMGLTFEAVNSNRAPLPFFFTDLFMIVFALVTLYYK